MCVPIGDTHAYIANLDDAIDAASMLATLEPAGASVVWLRCEGHSWPAIGKATGLGMKRTKTTYRRAIEQLRQRFTCEQEHEQWDGQY